MIEATNAVHHERVRRTAAALSELLAARADYRLRWQRHMRRATGNAVHQAAVATVLAHHVWDRGDVPDTGERLPIQMKHVVSRALAGQTLSPAVLTLFVDAFAMTQLDAAHLWSLYTGGDPMRLSVIRSEFAQPRDDPSARPRYQTTALHEFHRVGSGGLPESHRTVHVIRAVESLARYPYRFDTDAATVEVLRGGVAGPLYRETGTDIYGVDIKLTRPLRPGETASFEYLTTFNYQSPPAREFRRGVRERADNVEIHVQFDAGNPPRELHWCVWDDFTSRRPRVREAVELDPELSAHRYLDTVTASLVGFTWEFGP